MVSAITKIKFIGTPKWGGAAGLQSLTPVKAKFKETPIL